MRVTCGSASRNRGDSLRLPGAATNGAITLQLRSQKATTLSPLTFLWPLKPRLSPPFFRSQQRRLIAIARSRNKRCDHIAIAIAEGDDFIAFDFLVAAEAEVVAALLRCRGCAIPMDDADVQMIMFLQRRYRPNENGVQTTVRLPPAKGAVNARIVDFRTALLIFFDRQFLPLTPEVKRLQDVVEDRVQAQIRLFGPRLPRVRCGKTNCSNCFRLKCVGMHCQRGDFDISTTQAIGC